MGQSYWVVVLFALLVVSNLPSHMAADCTSTTAVSPCTILDGRAATVGGVSSLITDRGADQYFQFTFDSTRNSEVTVTVTTLYGDVDVYVTKPAAPGEQPRVPSVTDFDWASTTSGESDVITMAHSELVPGEQTYFILLHAVVDSMYVLMGSTQQGIIHLSVGIPQRETVQRGEDEYFQFDIPASERTKDLSITVTPLSGDPDLVVSTTLQYPNISMNCNGPCYDQRSSLLGGDVILFPHTRFGAAEQVYIAVWGYTTSTFTITVSMEAPVTLADGIPQAGSVLVGGGVYYQLNTGTSHEDITIRVTPIWGSVVLYVSQQAAGAADNLPTRTPPTLDVEEQLIFCQHDNLPHGQCVLIDTWPLQHPCV